MEAKTIFLLLITLLNTNLIYPWLEGTSSKLVIFHHSELLTTRRLATDLRVRCQIFVEIIIS